MKRSLPLTCLIVIGSLLIMSSSAKAITTLYAPDTMENLYGDFAYTVMISGLEENQNLATFDFTLVFDSSILKFKSYTFSDGLGSGNDILDWSSGDIGNGRVHLAEISWLQDFEQQPSSFELVTLIFQPLTMGITPVSFESVTLGDEWGGELSATLDNGKINVTPEPASMLLLGIGLIGVVGVMRKFGK